MSHPGTPRSPRVKVTASRDAPTKRQTLEPVEFARWLEQRTERFADRWLADLRARHARWSPTLETLLGHFFTLLTSMLPGSMGPYREHIESLWLQASELFGSVAAQRGLAAGEAVDEFQVIREVLIRELYADPPLGGKGPLSLRELLRLNRMIDRGVTQASIGHADALFFALFQGSGVPEYLDEQVTREVSEQLHAIRDELRSVTGAAKDSSP